MIAPAAQRQDTSLLPPVWVTLAIALGLAALSWPYAGTDLYTAYLPWFEHIRGAGPIGAFAAPFSDYTPPYLYLLALVSPAAAWIGAFAVVKFVSFGGHVLLVVALRRLLAVSGHAHPARAAAVIGLAPSLFVSPAVLVQCDAYWAAALVAALAAGIERRHVAMLVWCGLAVGFKLQAAFAAPLFLAVALAHSAPFRLWLLAPVATIATLVPAWLAGWPATDLLTIYFRQAGWSDQLALNAPNIWMIAQTLAPGLPLALGGVGTATAIAATVAYAATFARRLPQADAVTLLRAACLGAMIVPGLMPRMHERYFFMADVLTLALVMLRPAEWRVAALVQFGSAAAIMAYISGVSGLAVLGAASMLAATWLLARPYLLDHRPGRAPSVAVSGRRLQEAVRIDVNRHPDLCGPVERA